MPMPGCDPCCSGCACEFCDGATPQTLELVMSGWTGAGCDCLNDTFLLQCQSDHCPYESGSVMPLAGSSFCGAEWRYEMPYDGEGSCLYCRCIWLSIGYTADGVNAYGIEIPAGHYYASLEIGYNEEECYNLFYLDLGAGSPNLDCSAINWTGWTHMWSYPCTGSGVSIAVTLP